jgi:glutaredoxin
MSYIVYVSNHCAGCKTVMNFLSESQIDCQVINVDNNNVPVPENIFIFPALFKQEKLIAYGDDIINHLSKRAS